MKRAVIYARVSKQRDESVSVEAQILHCTARATALGATVVRVFSDDGISGQLAKNRGDFQKAKAFCAAGNVDFLITWSTSRFARNLMELWSNAADLKEGGTKLECLNADIDDETDSGFINKVFHGMMDEMLCRQISRDTLRSQKLSASQGYFTGGRIPFGYMPLPDGKRTRLQPHPENALIVRRMFDLCLQDKMGAQAIALRMNEAGMLRDGKRWGKNSVNYLLHNEVYMGIRTFNKTSKRLRKPKARSEWVQVQSHPPLVSKDDFERAQAMIELRTPHEVGGTARSTFLFTGLVRCGICSEKLQITNGTSRNGTIYNYYGCVGHRKGAPRCLFKQVRADLFDEWMLSNILENVLTLDVVRQAMQDLEVRGGEWVLERKTARAQLVGQIRELERARDNLYELLEEMGRNTPDLAGISKRLQERNESLLALQERLIALEASPAPSSPLQLDPAIALELAHEVVINGDAKNKRAFLGAFIESVTLEKMEATVSYRQEALIAHAALPSVHSVGSWLLNLGSNQGPTD